MKVEVNKEYSFESSSKKPQTILNTYQTISNQIVESKNEKFPKAANTGNLPSLSISSISHISAIKPQIKVTPSKANHQIISNANASTINSSRQILNEFKTLLKQTDYITSKISSFEPIENTFSNRDNKLFYESKSPQMIAIENNEPEEDNINDKDDLLDDSSVNLDEITTELQNYYKEQVEDNSSTEAHLIKSEINKLKLSNQVLTRSNLDLKNGNKKLELEINSYKMGGKISRKEIPSTEYDTNLEKFIQNSKSTLLETINQNMNIIVEINLLQKNCQQINIQNINLLNEYNEKIKAIKLRHRKNAENEITYQQNEKASEELERNNEILKGELEKRKIELSELLSKEENLNIINETNSKAKNDNDELLFQLKATIEKLTANNENNNSNLSKGQNEINNLSIILISRKKEIIEMIDMINRLNNELSLIQREGTEISQRVESKEEIELQLKQKEEEVQKKYEVAYIDNENAKKEIAEKDSFIEVLKENISKTVNIEENYPQEDIQDIEQDIMKALKENEMKKKELASTIKMYEDIIKKKDSFIKDLLEKKSDKKEEIEEKVDIQELDDNE